MKRFKQFLIERIEGWNPDVLKTQTLNPRRQDFNSQEEYLQALRDTAVKQKEEGQKLTSSGEQRANILGKVETGLKVADTIADATLSAGAVAVPGIGTALNATVKGLKSGMAASQGDYGKAALYAADAGLPALGRLASTGTQLGKATQIAKPALDLAKDVGAYIKNPVTGAVSELTKIGLQAKPISQMTSSMSNIAKGIGLSSEAANLLGQTSVKVGTKAAGEQLSSELENKKIKLT